MSRFTKAFALMTLALWVMATAHCRLEGVPGFGFLKTCCFVETGPSVPPDCGSDDCGPVEEGKYSAPNHTQGVPPPPAVLVILPKCFSDPVLQAGTLLACGAGAPAEIPKIWLFDHRTALSPRAPTLAS